MRSSVGGKFDTLGEVSIPMDESVDSAHLLPDRIAESDIFNTKARVHKHGTQQL
jgi:hypothetical protein